jgi:signal transduction histidine kinase
MTPPAPVDILLVDDNAENLVALRAILEQLGVRLVTASSGRDALRALLRQDFAVVLLDVNMPLLDGFETAALIRSRGRSSHTPIIFLTAYGDEEHLARGYELGAVDFIRTPVVPDVLRAKVAVFVELFRKSEEVRRQAEFLHRRAEQLHRLADAAMAISAATSVGAILAVLTQRSRDILRVRGALAHVNLGLRRRHEATSGDPPHGVGRSAAELVGTDGSLIGTVMIWEPTEGDFNAEDRAVLSQLAQMASIAIQNLVLAEERQANAIKDEFLATVSHELRTPLAAILTWTRLMRDKKLDTASLARAVDVIERNARSQARLIDDLLDMSRVMTGKLQLHVAPVDVHTVIGASVESASATAQSRGLELLRPAGASSLLVMADADRLQQIVLNLLENAMKFTPSGGRIWVNVVEHAGDVEIRVKDTGSGIESQFLPHVFDRFRQADSSSTRAHRGLGLGLAIVRQLVELHDGTVHVESPGPGKGTTFSVRIPRASIGGDAPPLEAATPGIEDGRGPGDVCRTRLDGVRVLLVEDEHDSREALSLLVAAAGADVRTADSVSAARAVLQTWPPDVVVSDIGLPHEDGYALLPAIRMLEQSIGRLVPAIALTAYVRPQDLARSIASGFVRHLGKPVDATALVDAIAELAATRRSRLSDVPLEPGGGRPHSVD